MHDEVFKIHDFYTPPIYSTKIMTNSFDRSHTSSMLRYGSASMDNSLKRHVWYTFPIYITYKFHHILERDAYLLCRIKSLYMRAYYHAKMESLLLSQVTVYANRVDFTRILP